MKASNTLGAAPAAKQKDLSRIGSIDYLLMTLGCCLAVFSGGLSISEPSIALFNVQFVLLGAIFSYVVRKIGLRSRIIRIDGVLYTAALLATYIFRVELNQVMPDGGFPREVSSAGWLCWMLMLGSFCTWQDSTLLFQSIPALALFGLVGCFDTFRNVIFAFFGFLLCLATLFARAHYRQMLRQAANSGFFTRGLAPGTPVPEVETTPGLAERMREGPWRWVAGPEWALGSAFLVVVISLLGAPVVQLSTKGVSGFVKVPQPPVRPQPPSTSAVTQSDAGDVKVGRGPNHLTHDPVLSIQMPGMHYLRSVTYDTYADRGWRNRLIRTSDEAVGLDPNEAAYAEIASSSEKEESIPFSIRLYTSTPVLPVPGIVRGWRSGRSMLTQAANGSLLVTGPYSSEFVGESVEPSPNVQPKAAQRNLPPVFQNTLSKAGIPKSVSDLAVQAAGKSGTDFVKAERIRQEIARRIKYNLNASATPPDKDPVEYALFDKQEGYCDLYASSMVLMARAVGIPARYVTGFLPEPGNEDGTGRFKVLDSDAHAWAELYFKGVGWVVFDATAGADSVPGGERGAITDNRSWYEKPWVKNLGYGLLGLALIASALLGWRIYQLRQKARTPRTDLFKSYSVFVKLLERQSGKRREICRTPDEFLAIASPSLGKFLPQAEALNRRYVAMLYGPIEPTFDQVAGLAKDQVAFAKELRAGGPRK